MPPPPPKRGGGTFSIQKTLASAANLSKLLPTNTVLIFQILKPSISSKCICRLPNKFLTIILISFCAIICFISSFTDSFVHSNRKLYFGFATFNGLYIFNGDDEIRSQNRRGGSSQTMMDKNNNDNSIDLSKFRIVLLDFFHAIVSMLVFLALGFSDGDVQKCLLGRGGRKLDFLVMNLPLVLGVLASLFFVIMPTMRRGIGYGGAGNRLT